MWRKLGVLAMFFGLVVLANGRELAAQAKKSDSVVKIQANATPPSADGRQEVTIDLDIEKGWHLYANPLPEDFPGTPTTVMFLGKAKPTGKINYPSGKSVMDAAVGKYSIYENKVTIKANVQRAPGDATPLELSIRLQACNENSCLVPATVKVAVPTK